MNLASESAAQTAIFHRKMAPFLLDAGRVRIAAAVAVLVSIAFAALMGDVINRDGITYINTAKAFLDRGGSAAMKVYNWPAYPILFGTLSHWTGLTFETSARIVNAVCILVLVDSFIRLHCKLEGSTAKPWVAALVILAFPPFGHRLDIMRDWGYLAFAMASFVPLQEFWSDRRGRVRDALGWQLWMFAAVLFRIEAVAMVALTPLVFLFQDTEWPARIRKTLILASWIAPVALTAAALSAAGQIPVGKLAEVLTYADPGSVFVKFNETAQFIATGLNKYSDDFAGIILAGGLVTIVGWMTIDNIGLLAAPILWGMFAYARPTFRQYGPIYWLLAITALTLLIFLATNLVIVSRYAMLTSLLAMLFSSSYIGRIQEHARESSAAVKSLWRLVVAGLVTGLLITISALPDYKAYIAEAGVWLQDNTPPGSTLITNDSLINYYSHRPLGPRLDSLVKVAEKMHGTPTPYYLALRLKDKQINEARRLVQREPVAVFHSSRAKEGLVVFHVTHPRANATSSTELKTKPAE